ncbi:hypothetical protein ACIBUY_33430 [Streptomyces sp. NPDC050085]|uniref:hypothetical protein n=1 Tax=Streptomyces sp. NPDC050085 TaxID=3365600 RepID=UPI00379BA5F4
MATRREPNAQLRALLRESGLTQEACARAVNAAAAEIGLQLGYDRTAVAHWLAGSEPKEPVPRLVAEVFSRRLGRLLTPASLGFAPPADARGAAAPGAAAALAELSRRDADPLEHARLTRAPYRALARVPGWAEHTARAATRPEHVRVGASEVALVRGAVGHFATAMDVHGGAHARSALAVYVADTAATWLRAPATDVVHRQLGVESARLVFVLALMHADMNAHGLAQRYFSLALSLAGEARDKEMWATTLRAMSAQALHLGHRMSALHCAEAAADSVAGSAPGAVRAYLYAQLAVARAEVGDRRAADAALARAEQSVQRDEGDGPFDTYPMGALAFQAAEVHSRLGRSGAAVRDLHRSAGARATLDRRGLVLTLSRRAELLLASGHLEEACASWAQFVRAGAGLRSRRVTDAHTRMRSALRPYGRHAAARPLLDGASSRDL